MLELDDWIAWLLELDGWIAWLLELDGWIAWLLELLELVQLLEFRIMIYGKIAWMTYGWIYGL